MSSNHPLREGKGSPYEGGIRVPWIIHLPGTTSPGSTNDQPIITCDIKPTVLDALQIASSDAMPIDGTSIKPALGGEALEPRALFWHFPHYRHGWTPYAIVRDGPYKLIHWFDGTQRELYQLDDDLGEQHNLADQESERLATMSAKLDQWLNHVNAKIPRRNPMPAPQ